MRAPRARACASDSSTTAPAPSPSTVPERRRSNGRHGALAPASCARMPDAANAAATSSWSGLSPPPASATSAAPEATLAYASPMATIADTLPAERWKTAPWIWCTCARNGAGGAGHVADERGRARRAAVVRLDVVAVLVEQVRQRAQRRTLDQREAGAVVGTLREPRVLPGLLAGRDEQARRAVEAAGATVGRQLRRGPGGPAAERGHRPHAAPPREHEFEQGRGAETCGRDGAHARDDDAARVHRASAASAVSAALRRSTDPRPTASESRPNALSAATSGSPVSGVSTRYQPVERSR